MSREHEFAIYAGDTFVDVGTAKELAERIGCLPGHIKHLSTPAHRRKLKHSKKPTGHAKYAVKLGAQL